MISSASTFFLAALVMLMSTSAFGAPIRPPVAPSEVIARAESVPQLVARTANLVDVPTVHGRSGLDMFTRRSARLLTEREPETLEVPVARDLVEEPEVQRRYPRHVYHDYYEKREPQPELIDIPAPVVQKREERPRVYPRRVYYEHYEKREPSPESAAKIKQTSIAVTNGSTFGTPQDLAAFNSNQLISGGSVGTTGSTAISLSQTQTIFPPASTTTTTGTATVVTATVSGSGTAATASATLVTAASGSGTATAASTISTGSTVSVTATATSIATGSASTATATPSAVISATSGPAVVTAQATVTSTDTGSIIKTSAVDSTATAGTTMDVGSRQPSAANHFQPAGGTKRTPPAGSTAAVGAIIDPGGHPPLSVDLPQPAGGTISFVNARDAGGTTNEPLIRRIAYSGATWASFVRRQSN